MHAYTCACARVYTPSYTPVLHIGQARTAGTAGTAPKPKNKRNIQTISNATKNSSVALPTVCSSHKHGSKYIVGDADGDTDFGLLMLTDVPVTRRKRLHGAGHAEPHG